MYERATNLGLGFQWTVSCLDRERVSDRLNTSVNQHLIEHSLAYQYLSSEMLENIPESKREFYWEVALLQRAAQLTNNGPVMRTTSTETLTFQELETGLLKYHNKHALQPFQLVILVPRYTGMVGPYNGAGTHCCLTERLWTGFETTNLAETTQDVSCWTDCSSVTLPIITNSVTSPGQRVAGPEVSTSRRSTRRTRTRLQSPASPSPASPRFSLSPVSPSRTPVPTAVEETYVEDVDTGPDPAEMSEAFIVNDDGTMEPIGMNDELEEATIGDMQPSTSTSIDPTSSGESTELAWTRWRTEFPVTWTMNQILISGDTVEGTTDFFYATLHAFANNLPLPPNTSNRFIRHFSAVSIAQPTLQFRVGTQGAIGVGVHRTVASLLLKKVVESNLWTPLLDGVYTLEVVNVSLSLEDRQALVTAGLIMQLLLRWGMDVLPLSPFIFHYLLAGCHDEDSYTKIVPHLDQTLAARLSASWPPHPIIDPLSGTVSYSPTDPAVLAAGEYCEISVSIIYSFIKLSTDHFLVNSNRTYEYESNDATGNVNHTLDALYSGSHRKPTPF